MFDVMSMFRQAAVNRLMQPFLTAGAENLLAAPGGSPPGNMLASAGMPIPSARPDPWAGLRNAVQIDQTKTGSASSGPAYQGPLVKHGDGQAGYPDGIMARSPSKPVQTGFENSGGVANAPPRASQRGSAPPQGVGKQGEIRRGGDGGNYQYAETAGMGGYNSDWGWIPTSQSGKPGLIGGLQQFGQSPFGQKLGDMAVGWSMGSNISDSLAQGGRMVALGNERRRGKAQTTANIEYLTKNGYDEQAAKAIASDGQALTTAIKQIHESRMGQRKPIEVNGQLVDPDTFKVVGDFRDKDAGAKATDDMREYQQAVGDGFKGTFMDYMIKMKEAGRNQVNIDTGVKLPTGFRWKDPNNQDGGVEPIPGGPGEQMPAELAARIGMADSFMKQLPRIRESVKTGVVTGPIDKTAASAGYGKGGETYRQIQSGVDGLMRLLTGAGMNNAEAEQYARRYLPTYMDDDQSMLGKLDQLERELNSAKDMAMRGRGGSQSQPAGQPTPGPQPGGVPAPGAVVDGYRFKGGNPADPNSWEPAQ